MLNDEGGSAGDDRGGLRRSASSEHPVSDGPGGSKVFGRIGAGRLETDDMGPRSDHVYSAQRCASRREGRHNIITVVNSTKHVGCTDDHKVRAGGRRTESPGLLAKPPVVPGRDHHEDAFLPRYLEGLDQRVTLPGCGRICAEGEEQHPNVHSIVVLVLDHPVDRRDHLADVRAATGIRNLD